MICDQDSSDLFYKYILGVRVLRYTGVKASEEGFVIFNGTTPDYPVATYYNLPNNELTVDALLLTPGPYTLQFTDTGGDGWSMNSAVVLLKGGDIIFDGTLASGQGKKVHIDIPYSVCDKNARRGTRTLACEHITALT